LQKYKDAGLHTIAFKQWSEKREWLNKDLSNLESAIRIL
ncbi:MAG: hypothetical protein K0R09_3577, partial [Clostridiales bacterium]|jgi:hypothetical protein|nr:hypothetical protein [Clostridiales bacterium]